MFHVFKFDIDFMKTNLDNKKMSTNIFRFINSVLNRIDKDPYLYINRLTIFSLPLDVSAITINTIDPTINKDNRQRQRQITTQTVVPITVDLLDALLTIAAISSQ